MSQLYLKHQAVKLPSLVVALTSELVIHNIEPEIAIHPSVLENFYDRQNTAVHAPAFQSGVSLESTSCIGSASRQGHGYDHINQVPGPSRCVGGCIIHCFLGPNSATGLINLQPRDHDSRKFKGAPNLYGNRCKHGHDYRSVPSQFVKSLGKSLHDVSFLQGCSYDVETRPPLVPDQCVSESSSFLEEEPN